MRARQEKGKRWKLEISRGRIRESSNTGPLSCALLMYLPHTVPTAGEEGAITANGAQEEEEEVPKGRDSTTKASSHGFPNMEQNPWSHFCFFRRPCSPFPAREMCKMRFLNSPPRRLLSRSVSFKNGGSKKEGGRSLPPLRLLHVVTMSQLLSRPLLLLSSHTRFK